MFIYVLAASLFCYLALLVWMLIDCLLYEQDRFVWCLVMLALPGLGPMAYFLSRFLPRSMGAGDGNFLARFKTGDLKRLRIAALQIGNAYHWVQYGDRLRETRRWEPASQAYREALAREPENLQAVWGLALCLMKQDQSAEALKLTEQILQIDPEYKFGDVSLARGRLLILCKHWDEARTHLQAHIRRWRLPEGLLLLARAEQESNNTTAARELLQELIMDIDASPPAIARRQMHWKRKAQSLLRSLPR